MNRKFWLEKIIKDNDYRIGAELGVLRGPTFKHLIENCPNLTLYGIDVFLDKAIWKAEGIITTEKLLEKEPVPWYKDLLKFADNYKPRAKIVRNFTALAANNIEDNSLDFVFIDADHRYAGVKKDIDAWYPKVKKGGLVSGHDINMPEVKKAVDEEFGDNYLSGKSILGYNIGPDNIWYTHKE